MSDKNDKPRILVLKTGSTFRGARRRFGDFDRWFLDALRGAPATFRVHDVTRRPPPPLEAYDGVLVTGSPAAVCEAPGWLPPLLETLRRSLRQAQGPALLGVCFGAQALAAAIGGSVARNPLGWEIGTIRVRRSGAAQADALLGGPEASTFQATHQDVIEALPGGAVVLAGNAMCPIQAFRTGSRAWGVQFHPEASAAILEDLIRARREVLFASGPAASRARGYQALLEGLAPTPAGRTLLLRFLEISRRG